MLSEKAAASTLWHIRQEDIVLPFSQSQLDALAQRYTDAWNSKVPENVARFHTAESRIVINRGEPSLGHAGLTAITFVLGFPNQRGRCSPDAVVGLSGEARFS